MSTKRNVNQIALADGVIQITSLYVRYRAAGKSRWVYLFNGEATAQRFDKVGEALRLAVKAAFLDEAVPELHTLLRTPDAKYYDRGLLAPAAY